MNFLFRTCYPSIIATTIYVDYKYYVNTRKYTVAYPVVKIWLKFLGDFGAKTSRFTTVNMPKIGPLKIRIVLY